MSQLATYGPSLLLAFISLLLITTGLLQLASMRNKTRLIQRDIAAVNDTLQKKRFKKEVILEKQKLAENVVDKGSSTVQTVHKVVSDLTFDILGSIPTTRHTSNIVRKVHDRTSTTVYETVRTVNKQIGELSNDILKPVRNKDSIEKK